MNEQKYGKMPLLGEKFPKLKVKSTHGIKRLPDDYAGSWFILFSHPADFTPVCTTEFLAFAEKHGEFKKKNCELIGLSIDQVFSHLKWLEWIKDKLDVEIYFPIIADEKGEVANALGMIHPSLGNNTVRAVFIVDDKGVLRLVLYYPQEVGRNIDEIFRVLEALQISDKKGVALPANWPNNSILKDRVIIPPADTEEIAKKRPDEYDCYDWWFCHKSL